MEISEMKNKQDIEPKNENETEILLKLKSTDEANSINLL
jgi:hypothetical protein